MSPVGGAVRLARASVLGACCLLLSLTAHVLAGGHAPGPLALLVLVVPVACLSVLVTGRRAGGYRIGLTLGLTQVGLHQAFMLLAQPPCVLASSPPAGTGHAAMHIASCAPAMAMPGPPPVMVAAHVAAAAATGLLLGQGERLLWSILGWLGPRRPTASGAAPLPVTHWAPHHDVRRPARRTVQTGGLGRRGPPVMHAT